MRLLFTVAILFVTFAGTASVEAQAPYYKSGGHYSFWGDYHRSYIRNKMWPKPYQEMDRAATAAPFGIMVHNGWRQQNLIGQHHFKKDTAELNESGLIKVRWIATQTPVQQRTVFVERGTTQDETAARLREVQAATERFVVGGDIPDVRETGVVSHRWPGEYIDLINNKFRSSTKDPRLPASSGGFKAN